MRSEKEMHELIIKVATEDERIRAVYINGSRTNPNAPKDIYQDYDIVYVVTDTLSFIKDKNWIHVFGELLMLQEPDRLNRICGIKTDFSRSYTYLMLFTDGNRIDLTLQTKETMLNEYEKDTLTVPLLDKDHCLPPLPDTSDRGYWIKAPTASLFLRNCNNFWWCLQNVAKGIKRDELPYAKRMFECVVRDMLDEMVTWWIGINHHFALSSGKMGKYFKKYLPSPLWEMYQATYSDGYSSHFWDSIFTSCDLFHVLASFVANHYQFHYSLEDENNMIKYLKQVKGLAKNAKNIF